MISPVARNFLSENVSNIAITAILLLGSISLIVTGSLNLLGSLNHEGIIIGSFITLFSLSMAFRLFELLNFAKSEAKREISIREKRKVREFPNIESQKVLMAHQFEAPPIPTDFFDILNTPEYESVSFEPQDVCVYLNLELYFEYWVMKCGNLEIFRDWASINENELSILKLFDHKTIYTTPIAFPFPVDKKHWTLVFVDPQRRVVEYYDSKMNHGSEPKINNFLEALANQFSVRDTSHAPYRYEKKISKKLQTEDFQSSLSVIWVLYFLEKRLSHPTLDFNQIEEGQINAIIDNFDNNVKFVINQMKMLLGKSFEIELKRYLKKFPNREEAIHHLNTDKFKKYTEASSDHRKLGPFKYHDYWLDRLNGQLLSPQD